MHELPLLHPAELEAAPELDLLVDDELLCINDEVADPGIPLMLNGQVFHLVTPWPVLRCGGFYILRNWESVA
jgi:hypothetical protein